MRPSGDRPSTSQQSVKHASTRFTPKDMEMRTQRGSIDRAYRAGVKGVNTFASMITTDDRCVCLVLKQYHTL